jgi:hypothetical protein
MNRGRSGVSWPIFRDKAIFNAYFPVADGVPQVGLRLPRARASCDEPGEFHQTAGERIGCHTRREVLMRLLFLTRVLPFPLDAGPKVRAYYTLRCLAEQGHALTLVSFVRKSDSAKALAHAV